MTSLQEPKQAMKHALAQPMRECVLMRAAEDGVYYTQRSFEQYYGDSYHWDASLSLTKQCFLHRAGKICPQRCAEMRKGSDEIYYARVDFKSAARWAAAGPTAIRCSLTKSDFHSAGKCAQKLCGRAAAQDLPGDRPIPFSSQAAEGAPPKCKSCRERWSAAAHFGDPAHRTPDGSELGLDAAIRGSSVDSSGVSLSPASADGDLYTALVDNEAQARGRMWSAEGAALAGMLAAALQAATEARKAEATARAAAEAAAQREQELCADIAALRQYVSAWASRDQALQLFVQRQMAAEEEERRDAAERSITLACLPEVESADRRCWLDEESVARDRLQREQMLWSHLSRVRARGEAGGWQPTGAAPLSPRPLPPTAKQLRERGAVHSQEKKARKVTAEQQAEEHRRLWRRLRRSRQRAVLADWEAARRRELADGEGFQRALLADAMSKAGAEHTIVCSADRQRWKTLVGLRANGLLRELLASGDLEGASIDPTRVLALSKGAGRYKGPMTERAGNTLVLLALKNGVADGVLVATTFESISDEDAVAVGHELGVLSKEHHDRRDACWPPELAPLLLPDRVRRLVLVAGVATRRGARCRGLGRRLHEALWSCVPCGVTHSLLQPAVTREDAALHEPDRDSDGDTAQVTNPKLVSVYQWGWGYRFLLRDERERRMIPPTVGQLSSADEVLELLQQDRDPEKGDAAEQDVVQKLDQLVDEAQEGTRLVLGDTTSPLLMVGCRPLPLFAGLQLRGCSTTA
eukprot:TRINITY_DN10498_c0_g1_i2.p1 TRINITY_DN10498_c0_g1~~TRINITY_DN10498_c0_g1_i2.p1  ORF type:complete len:778 (+),score=239.07 TRINITY_DN10498_c0_g1_i2:81-2336(+)